MVLNVFHVFRNTPMGQETLRQAADFTKKISGRLWVYIPEFDRFMIYFETEGIEISLDGSYLYSPETAQQNLQKVLKEIGIPAEIVESTTKTGSILPDIHWRYDVISLPKIMTEARGGLVSSSLGSGVRRLIKMSPVPAIIGPGRFAEWSSVRVFFGGSEHALRALKWAQAISSLADFPLTVCTLVEEDREEQDYRRIMEEAGIDTASFQEWLFYRRASLIDVLNETPRDSLLVMGAYGHSKIKARLFGSKTELVLKNNANLLMLVGEACRNPGTRNLIPT